MTRIVSRFMSRSDVARRMGLKSIRSLSGTELPPHDVEVGTHKGWRRETIEKWLAARPGRGWHGQR